MRTMLKAILILLMLTVAAPVAMAGNFPEKPISVIVPWKPGGGTDILARAVCPVWEKYLGVSMRIVNKPGGNNIVGYSAMFAAPHDGYTIVLGQAPNYNINVLFQDASTQRLCLSGGYNSQQETHDRPDADNQSDDLEPY